MENSTGHPITGQAVTVVHPAGRNSPRPAAPPALLILSVDGFVELFADHLRVLVVQRLDVDPQEEVLADDLLTARLPQAFKNLYFPSKRRAIGQCRRVTPEDRIDTLVRTAALREIQELAR